MGDKVRATAKSAAAQLSDSRVPIVKWEGAYDVGWKGLICDQAFAHPAKAGRGLLERIYNQLFALGALKRGDTVCDPFGGIGTTGIIGARRGVQVVCVELEPKFYDLARQNIALHRADWEAMGWPIPIILQGDSRRLRAVLREATVEAVVGSPPYVSGGHHPDQTGAWNTNERGQISAGTPTVETAGYGDHLGQIGQMAEGNLDAAISSPPYAGNSGRSDATTGNRDRLRGDDISKGGFRTSEAYGRTPEQLGRMETGSVDAVVSSPPFLDARRDLGTTASVKGSTPTAHDPEAMGTADGNLAGMSGGVSVDAVVSSPPWGNEAEGGFRASKFKHPEDALKAGRGHGASDEARLRQLARDEEKTYGTTDGQLAQLPVGPVDSIVSSPPYEGSLSAAEDGIDWTKVQRETTTGGKHQAPGASAAASYPPSTENLGNQRPETFWAAALQIVRECHAMLKPGGHAAWIVKAFVRDGKIQDFPGDWRRLCEHVGFETVLEARAMLVKEERTSHLFDGEVVTRRARKSFFRRLYESKFPHNAIDYETAYFMRKPR